MARRRPGITNRQAKVLADLCRQLGQSYPGSGMRRGDAAVLIDALMKERDAKRRKFRDQVEASKRRTEEMSATTA